VSQDHDHDHDHRPMAKCRVFALATTLNLAYVVVEIVFGTSSSGHDQTS